MSCKFDRDIIQRYTDNTIDPLELIVLKEHIKVCQDCKFELELMSKLENSMYEYFDNIPGNDMLEEFSMKVLEQCYVKNEKQSLGQRVVKVWELNKTVAANAVRYTEYLPGSKLVASAAKKAGKGLNKAAKNYVKTNLKRLIAGAVK